MDDSNFTRFMFHVGVVVDFWLDIPPSVDPAYCSLVKEFV